MLYRLAPDGTLIISNNNRQLLKLKPFVGLYGMRFTAISGQTQGTILAWKLANNQTLTASLSLLDDGYRLMFHGKPAPLHIGVAVALRPGGPWYGMGERFVQGWPLETTGVIAQPFIPYDHAGDGRLNIGTPVWLGAAGLALFVEQDTGPLDVHMDADPQGTLYLTSFAPAVSTGSGLDGAFTLPEARLGLRMIIADDLPQATQQTIHILGHPASSPPLELFARPTWTTWARYKMSIDQAQTVQFAQAIVAHQFPRSVLEIDDRWQTAYGDLAFDPIKFPDPRAMVDELHVLGFRVTLWVPPFFDPVSPTYHEAAQQGYLVRHPATQTPYLTRWWQGWGGLLDVSNPAALVWWRTKLSYLQTTYGIDGFKFDGGEGNFFPIEAETFSPMTQAEYTDRYVAFVAAHWQWTEVRTAWRSQSQGILFREWDKSSHWGLDNGLHSVITAALTLSVIGYPFVLPDMIGGNAYAGEVPDRELLIRWTQVTALLPTMQFSIPPWDYDAEVITICRRYTDLHEQLTPYLAELIAQTTRNGTPLVRPLWWHFPAEPMTYTVNDQWLLGPDWLVAPVILAGATSRDVYLPTGSWRDHWTGAILHGPTIVQAYPAPLDMLPLFKRVSYADGALNS